MAAVDDLTELVERAAAAERTALASKWKERADVEKMVRNVRKNAENQRAELDQQARHRPAVLALGGAAAGLSRPGRPAGPAGARADRGRGLAAEQAGRAVRRLSHAAAAQAERDAVAAVQLARLALTDAALAVVQARLARIDAGEDDPDAAVVDGHVPLHGRNPVSRHGPALAHGVTGEIKYILGRKPRSTMKSLAIALAMGLLYLGWIRLFQWDTDRKWLPYLGLWAIGVVMGGSVCVNAMSFDAMRVRAALDSGAAAVAAAGRQEPGAAGHRGADRVPALRPARLAGRRHLRLLQGLRADGLHDPAVARRRQRAVDRPARPGTSRSSNASSPAASSSSSSRSWCPT